MPGVSDATDDIKSEVEAIQQLCGGQDAHKHVVRVLKHGALPGLPYYFIDMELCDLNLSEYIHGNVAARSESLPCFVNDAAPSVKARQIWDVMIHIAGGLEYIHSQGYVHRDIKPENVLYSCKDTVWKLGDFGLTREGNSMNIPTYYARGTPGYRAPELVNPDGKSSYSYKVDIWSLGCILYEFATGKKAFTHDGEVLLHRHLGQEKDVALDDTYNECSQGAIKSTIVKLLQIEPSSRPSASTVLNEFVGHRDHTYVHEVGQVDVPSITELSEWTLVTAAQKGHVNVVKGLLEANADVTTRGEYNLTALHQAAWYGYTDIAKMLLEANSDVDARDINSQTPLHFAGDRGHTEVVRLLLDSKCDFEATDIHGQTPLHRTAYHGQAEIVKMLLDANANVAALTTSGSTALQISLLQGHLEVLKIILPKVDLEPNDGEGQRALHAAAQGGNIEIVKMLLDAKVDVAAVGYHGTTALHVASAVGHTEVVKLLLDANADVAALDAHGQTPLHRPAYNGHSETVKLLTETNIDVTARDYEDWTALERAADQGYTEIVRILKAAASQKKLSS